MIMFAGHQRKLLCRVSGGGVTLAGLAAGLAIASERIMEARRIIEQAQGLARETWICCAGGGVHFFKSTISGQKGEEVFPLAGGLGRWRYDACPDALIADGQGSRALNTSDEDKPGRGHPV